MKLHLTESATLQMPPKEVGYYKVGICQFFAIKKPHLIHRFFCKLVLGFIWHEL